MNKYIPHLPAICSVALLLLASIHDLQAVEFADSQEKMEMMYKLQLLESKLEAQKLREELEDELQTLEADIQIVQSRLNQRDNAISNYIDAISWVSGIVIGFVGLLFGIGAFILYRENQDVTNKAKQQLDQFNERAADQQRTFDSWFQEAKRKYTIELEQMNRIMRLRVLLDQEHPSSAEIYPDLSPLYANPKLEYLPIFKKVLTLEIDADIKRNAQAAIDHLAETYREA